MALFNRTLRSAMGRPARDTRAAARDGQDAEDQQRAAEHFGRPLLGRQRRRGRW